MGAGVAPDVGGCIVGVARVGGCSRVVGIGLGEVAGLLVPPLGFGIERSLPTPLYAAKLFPYSGQQGQVCAPRSTVLRSVAERQSPLFLTVHKKLCGQCKKGRQSPIRSTPKPHFTMAQVTDLSCKSRAEAELVRTMPSAAESGHSQSREYKLAKAIEDAVNQYGLYTTKFGCVRHNLQASLRFYAHWHEQSTATTSSPVSKRCTAPSNNPCGATSSCLLSITSLTPTSATTTATSTPTSLPRNFRRQSARLAPTCRPSDRHKRLAQPLGPLQSGQGAFAIKRNIVSQGTATARRQSGESWREPEGSKATATPDIIGVATSERG